MPSATICSAYRCKLIQTASRSYPPLTQCHTMSRCQVHVLQCSHHLSDYKAQCTRFVPSAPFNAPFLLHPPLHKPARSPLAMRQKPNTYRRPWHPQLRRLSLRLPTPHSTHNAASTLTQQHIHSPHNDTSTHTQQQIHSPHINTSHIVPIPASPLPPAGYHAPPILLQKLHVRT